MLKDGGHFPYISELFKIIDIKDKKITVNEARIKKYPVPKETAWVH
jgi:hypothetical protein